MATVLGVGVVLFFSLTRTQVGRDALRQRIERQFNQTFEGRLEIGTLKGNLVQQFFADDVRLYDPEGRLMLHVDSVVANPNWSDLLRQRFSVGSLTLLRPTFHVLYQADSTWNVADAFRRRVPVEQPSGPQPWSFDSADLYLIDGAIETMHEAALPQPVEAGWLFNFAGTTARDVQTRATIEWGTDVKLIDVLSFSALLPEVPFTMENMQGQLVIEPERVLVNQLVVEAGETDLRFDGAIEQYDSLRTGALDALALDITLAPSRLDFAALRVLFPHLPLADAVAASMRLQGPLSQLVIEEAALTRGQSRIRAEGTLLGFPDSLDFDLALRNTTVTAADLRAVLPSVTFPDLEHLGVLTINGTAEGVAHGDASTDRLRLRAEGTLDVRGSSGHVNATIALRQQPGRLLGYTLDLTTDSLNVGLIARDNRFTSLLNGRARLQGRGLSLDSLDTTLRADLFTSQLAGRRVDTFHVDASIVGRRLEATAAARQDRQGVFANAVLDWNTRQPSYRLGLITRRLDLGMLLASDSLRSSLNTQWTLEGTGLAWDDLRGELAVTVDPSAMQWGTTARSVPVHRSVVTVNAPAAEAPRLHVTGDALSLRLDGDTSAEAMQALAALWRYALGEAWDRQAEKIYARAAPTPSLAAARFEGPSLDQLILQGEARRVLQNAGLDTLTLDLALAVKRSDVLAALLPMVPRFDTDFSTDFRLTADADRLHLLGSARADSIRLNALGADAYRADFSASAHLDEPIEASLQASFDARADTLLLARQVLRAPRVTARYQDRTGRFGVALDRHKGAGPANVTATLDLLPDRHRLTMQEVDLTVGGYIWNHPEDEIIDLFVDAVVFPGMLLESQPADSVATQRIRVRGALSNAPQDTLFVDLEAIGLEQLSDFLAGKRSFGGRLNGQLAFTGEDQRELTGALTIDALALDDRLLGHLEASSRYLPGAPDVALDLTLLPIDPDDPLLPTVSPALRLTENHLRLSGTFRLPQTNNDDPGALDLKLDAQRADAFFFEYIIKEIANVEGAFAGTGAVRGTFDYPLFEADLALSDGRFYVPEFNLRYKIEGPVRVDDEGIRLDQVFLSDYTDGSAIISGSLFFNDYRFFSFDLSGRLDDIQIIDVSTYSRQLPFYGTIWASGDATLTGPLDNAFLRADNVVTSQQSELFIPIITAATVVDPGFIIFADSTGQIPEEATQIRRDNILADRPVGERTFIEGIEMDLNILAPQGSTVHLVIDPLLGDVINAVGSGRIQLQLQEGDISTFGSFEVDSGDYLFTAGELFVRRFLINEGTIIWTGDPLNPSLDIQAAYRTRASRTGLPEDVGGTLQSSLPLIVDLHITGALNAVLVALTLTLDRSRQEAISDTPLLEAYLNQPDRAAQHATSVLLTNSFLLSTEGTSNDVLAGSAFNSVSQLVSSQLNRYLSQVIPNADFTFGVQSDETADDLDVSAGIAIRLLNERLVIRGQGVYRGLGDQVEDTAQQGLEGEFIVEVRLSPTVSVEVFYRREGDVLSESLITSETGAGLSYRTEFSTWRKLIQNIFGRKKRDTASDSTDVVVDAKDNR